MKIDTNAIVDMNKSAALQNEEITLVGYVTVKRGGFEIRCHNFGIGYSYEEALENLKSRCSREDDKSDVISVDVHDVYVGETFFMGDINA